MAKPVPAPLLQRLFFALTFAGLICVPVCLADAPLPELHSRVTDLTGTLTSSQQTELEQRLAAFERAKGSQVAVVIVSTTQPETIEQYSIRLVDKWKIGRKGVDDGALLIIAHQDRTLRIEVGYGLEGALTDLRSKQIIEDIIIPYFKKGDFYGGVSSGVDAIIAVIQGEKLPEPAAQTRSGSDPGALIFIVFGALIAGSILRSIIGRPLAAVVSSAGAGLVAAAVFSLVFGIIAALVVFMLVVANAGRSYGTPYGPLGGSTGGFGSRSSGGGGFSGGGGSFGGGGASGRW